MVIISSSVCMEINITGHLLFLGTIYVPGIGDHGPTNCMVGLSIFLRSVHTMLTTIVVYI